MPRIIERLKSRTGPKARRVAGAALAIAYTGDHVECPCCGGHFRRFMTRNGRANAQCPRCFSLERLRLLWLYLDKSGLLESNEEVLHFAPERPLQARLERSGLKRYVSADIDPKSSASYVVDITDIQFPAESFDLVLCNHVLEHIPDDHLAMREMRRVLRTGGTLITQHPMDPKLQVTVEDPSETSPAERLMRFNQVDHVRIYGRDFTERLSRAGFQVTNTGFFSSVSPADAQRYGLREGPGEAIFACRAI